MKIWEVNCMEEKYPGLFQRWFRDRCLAVGCPVQYAGLLKLCLPRYRNKKKQKFTAASASFMLGLQAIFALALICGCNGRPNTPAESF
jgi:hypothetical protein